MLSNSIYRMNGEDELARKYAETHDQEVKAELEELSHLLADLLTPRENVQK